MAYDPSQSYPDALKQYLNTVNNNDYSQAYSAAQKIANNQANQQRTGYQNQLNLLNTNRDTSLNGVDTALTNNKQDLQDTSFQKYLASRQSLANNGLSGTGLANDADTRLQLVNNRSLAQIENNANQQRYAIQNAYNTQSQGIQDQMNQVDPSAMTAQLYQQFQAQAAQQNAQKAQELFNYANTLRGDQQQTLDNQFRQGQADKAQANEDWSKNFQMGQATGRMTTPQMQDLMNKVIQDKQNWAATTDPNQRNVIAQDAVNVRNQLSSMGIDANRLFGADVPLAQAQKNLGQAYIPTLSKQQQDYGMYKDQRDFGYQKQQDTIKNQQWNQSFNADQSFKNASLGLDQQRLSLQQSAQNFDQNMATWKATGVAQGIPGVPDGTPYDARSVQTANATNGVLAKLMGAPDRTAAMKALTENAGQFAKDGVDVISIAKMVDGLFPANSVAGGPKVPIPQYDPQKWDSYQSYLKDIQGIMGNP